SQISLTLNLPSDLKATWYSSPSGSQSPDFSSWRMVASYCSVVTSDVGAKRTRKLVLRASMTGAADGLVVAIDGLLRVSAPDRADLQPSTSHRRNSADLSPLRPTLRACNPARPPAARVGAACRERRMTAVPVVWLVA